MSLTTSNTMSELYCLPVKMIICTFSNGFLDEDFMWTLCWKIGRVRDIQLLDFNYEVYFYHVWDAQRAVVQLNNRTFDDGIRLHVRLPEPTRVLWLEMKHVNYECVEEWFRKYGEITVFGVYEEGIIIQYVKVESAINALVSEQRNFYSDKSYARHLLHVDFVVDSVYNEPTENDKVPGSGLVPYPRYSIRSRPLVEDRSDVQRSIASSIASPIAPSIVSPIASSISSPIAIASSIVPPIASYDSGEFSPMDAEFSPMDPIVEVPVRNKDQSVMNKDQSVMSKNVLERYCEALNHRDTQISPLQYSGIIDSDSELDESCSTESSEPMYPASINSMISKSDTNSRSKPMEAHSGRSEAPVVSDLISKRPCSSGSLAMEQPMKRRRMISPQLSDEASLQRNPTQMNSSSLSRSSSFPQSSRPSASSADASDVPVAIGQTIVPGRKPHEDMTRSPALKESIISDEAPIVHVSEPDEDMRTEPAAIKSIISDEVQTELVCELDEEDLTGPTASDTTQMDSISELNEQMTKVLVRPAEIKSMISDGNQTELESEPLDEGITMGLATVEQSITCDEYQTEQLPEESRALEQSSRNPSLSNDVMKELIVSNEGQTMSELDALGEKSIAVLQSVASSNLPVSSDNLSYDEGPSYNTVSSGSLPSNPSSNSVSLDSSSKRQMPSSSIRVLYKQNFVGKLQQTFQFLVDICPRSKWNSKTSLVRKLRKDQNEFRANLDRSSSDKILMIWS